MTNQETSLLTGTGKPRFFYGYVVVAVSLGILTIAHGLHVSFGVFFNPLQTEFGWSRATISGAASLSLLLMGFLAIIMGSLNDRFGPRIVIAGCGFFCGLGYLLMSQVNTIWQLYLFYGVIIGIGVSAMDVVLLSTIARWFVKKRGTMSGVLKVGTGLGILIMPIMANWLISTYGWRTSYIILGTLALVLIILGAQFLKRDPGQMRQLPDGKEQATAGSSDLEEEGLSLRETIHTRQFWTICTIYLTILFCAQTILVHIAPYAVDLRISATNAASIISIIGGVSIVGRLVMGNAGDRVGNKRALIICFLILIVPLFWLQLAKELWMLYLFAVIYGFAHGGFFALISPTVAGLFGMHSQGVILGTVIFSGTIGGSISPVLAGHIFDITGSYQPAFLILGVFSIIGLILTTSLRPIISKGGTNDPKRSA